MTTTTTTRRARGGGREDAKTTRERSRARDGDEAATWDARRDADARALGALALAPAAAAAASAGGASDAGRASVRRERGDRVVGGVRADDAIAADGRGEDAGEKYERVRLE